MKPSISSNDIARIWVNPMKVTCMYEVAIKLMRSFCGTFGLQILYNMYTQSDTPTSETGKETIRWIKWPKWVIVFEPISHPEDSLPWAIINCSAIAWWFGFIDASVRWYQNVINFFFFLLSFSIRRFLMNIFYYRPIPCDQISES